MKKVSLHFTGTFDELAELLEREDFHGVWRDLPYVKQLGCFSGAIINFAPSTGRIWLQGVTTSAFEEAVRAVLTAAHGGSP